LKIELEKDSKPTVINDTDYLFHVFNSEYVSDNLEKHKYKPNDDIQGYILGKVNIDVTNEKLKQEELEKQRNLKYKELETVITNAKVDLDDLGVSKRLNEYKNITFKNLLSDLDINENKSFDIIKSEYQQLISMPDGINDVSLIKFDIDSSKLESIKKLLSKSYEKSQIDQDFVNEIKTKLDFIEKGLNLLEFNNKVCPFCKQGFSANAIKIIELYNKFFQDEEAKTIREIDGLLGFLDNLKSNIIDYYSEFNEIHLEYDKIENFLPSHKKADLKLLIDNKSVLDEIDQLITMLKTKKLDISSSNFNCEEQIEDITNFLKQLKDNSRTQNDQIKKLNQIKNSIDEEKRQLRRKLCNAKFLAIKNEHKLDIDEYTTLESDISEIIDEIKLKESKAKFDRKTKVVESLNYF